MFLSGATITSERITTSSLPQRIQRARIPALPVFCGVGRGGSTSRMALDPLAAVCASLVPPTTTTTTGFGWFVSWISSVVVLDLCSSASLKAQPSYIPSYICDSSPAGVV